MASVVTCPMCRERFVALEPDDDMCLSCLEGQDAALFTLVEDVRVQAEQAYSAGSPWWRVVVEEMTDADLARVIGRAWTARGARTNVWRQVVEPEWQRMRARERQAHFAELEASYDAYVRDAEQFGSVVTADVMESGLTA